MRPAGTAHVAISAVAPCGPPRAISRRSPTQTATTMPTMMHSAYARIGNGPRSMTPLDGLGIDARTTRRRLANLPHALGQVRGQRGAAAGRPAVAGRGEDAPARRGAAPDTR